MKYRSKVKCREKVVIARAVTPLAQRLPAVSICILAVSLLAGSVAVLADGVGWKSINAANGALTGQATVDDEWRELGKPAASNDGWGAVNEQRESNLKTLVPTLSALDASVAAEVANRERIASQIVEFGDEGSGANFVVTDDNRLEQSPDTVNLDMFAGELKVLGKVDVTRVAIGNGGIIRAEILNTGELLVIAQQAGSTSLRLWNKDDSQSSYNIRVSESDSETRVRMERMVRMRVRIVEFRKSDITKLGVDWSVSADGPTFAAAGDAIGNNLFRPESGAIGGLPNVVKPFSTYFGITSNITSKINFFTQKGDAVTLAEPVLSAMNGGQASFLAGGEIPYPSTSENGQPTVDFKEYGVRLKVAPSIDSLGNVRTYIETEVSSIDSSVTVGGAPGLRTRKASTQFNVQSGETIVISGLLTTDISNSVKMVPGLGRLPIIGKLFRSEEPSEAVNELIIFVTPEVIDPSVGLNTVRENRRYDETNTRLREARKQLPLME